MKYSYIIWILQGIVLLRQAAFKEALVIFQVTNAPHIMNQQLIIVLYYSTKIHNILKDSLSTSELVGICVWTYVYIWEWTYENTSNKCKV